MNFLSHFTSMLNAWQWAILLSVPPAIIALYFLKLKRQPLEVPSTYLWHRTIEDLHVNSIWQRLRQSILLLLQLLVLLLVILACLRPSWRGTRLTGDRYVFLIDTSASMSATDVAPTRLEEAKKRVGNLLQQMKPGDVAMLVSFSDRAQVEQPFTDNRRLLRRRIDAIQPTQRTSDLDEALRVAAGLANPGRSGERGTGDTPVADALPATMFIFSDGGFHSVPEFSMGNLKPVYVPLGSEQAANVGIVAFNAGRSPEKPDQLQAFARLENYGDQEVQVEVALYLDDRLVRAAAVTVPSQGSGGAEFVIQDVPTGVLRLEIEQPDSLALDNVAYATINAPRRAKVLLVTPGNDALETALATDALLEIADVSLAEPALLQTKAYADQAAAGAYDLVIYDRCTPPEKKMPQASTLLIGHVPPGEAWAAETRQAAPQIIDTDRAHPLMQFVELGNVKIAEGTPLKGPPGSTVLIDSDVGSLLVIGPRAGFEDAVLGFEIIGTDEQGETYANTDWPIRLSFPLFIGNALRYFGGGREAASLDSVQPGRSIALKSPVPVERIRVQGPRGNVTEVPRGAQHTYVFGATDRLGVYQVRSGKDSVQQFAVNLFDGNESNIRPRPEIRTTYTAVPGQTAWETTRREGWKYLLLAAIGLVVVEWYVYNRRVYL